MTKGILRYTSDAKKKAKFVHSAKRGQEETRAVAVANLPESVRTLLEARGDAGLEIELRLNLDGQIDLEDLQQRYAKASAPVLH